MRLIYTYPGDTVQLVERGEVTTKVVALAPRPTDPSVATDAEQLSEDTARRIADLQAESDRHFAHAQSMQRACFQAQEAAKECLAQAEAARADLAQAKALLTEVSKAPLLAFDVATGEFVVRLEAETMRSIRKAVA